MTLLPLNPSKSLMVTRVWLLILGLCFFPSKVASDTPFLGLVLASALSVDRFGKKFGGLLI